MEIKCDQIDFKNCANSKKDCLGAAMYLYEPGESTNTMGGGQFPDDGMTGGVGNNRCLDNAAGSSPGTGGSDTGTGVDMGPVGPATEVCMINNGKCESLDA